MLYTSAIRHPENDMIMVVREWQVSAVLSVLPHDPSRNSTSTTVASTLLSLFEYHYNNRAANKLLRFEMDRHFKREQGKPTVYLGEWLPYTWEYLREATGNRWLMLTIKNNIKPLEDLGFIHYDLPKDIADIFQPRIRMWIRLDVQRINDWIDKYVKKSWLTGHQPEAIPEYVAPVVEPKTVDTKTALVNALCDFHKHIHAKKTTYVYDNKRKTKVMARVKERYALKDAKGKKLLTDEQVIGQCSQVIIGNALSPFHNGTNDRTKVYDDIEMMFRDAAKFENHITYAEVANVSEVIAYRQFMKFLAGEPSRYAKKGGAGTTNLRPTNMRDRAYLELSDEAKNLYRDFSRSIASFFLTDTPIKDILEVAKTNASLKKFNRGITDMEALVIAINIQLRVFRPNGIDEKVQNSIQKFSATFCRLQQINT